MQIRPICIEYSWWFWVLSWLFWLGLEYPWIVVALVEWEVWGWAGILPGWWQFGLWGWAWGLVHRRRPAFWWLGCSGLLCILGTLRALWDSGQIDASPLFSWRHLWRRWGAPLLWRHLAQSFCRGPMSGVWLQLLCSLRWLCFWLLLLHWAFLLCSHCYLFQTSYFGLGLPHHPDLGMQKSSGSCCSSFQHKAKVRIDTCMHRVR